MRVQFCAILGTNENVVRVSWYWQYVLISIEFDLSVLFSIV